MLYIFYSNLIISNLAFHPTVRLLAIGTFNEVLFWDWSRGDVSYFIFNLDDNF